jgi:hypothetical protein
MNAVLALGLLFAGVKFADLKTSKSEDLKTRNLRSEEIQNGKDVYESNEYDNKYNELFRRAYYRNQDAKYTSQTGMVPNGYNQQEKDNKGNVIDIGYDQDPSELITEKTLAALVKSKRSKEPEEDFLGNELKITDNTTNEEKFFKETVNDNSYTEQFKPLTFDKSGQAVASNDTRISDDAMKRLDAERKMGLDQGFSTFNKNANMTYNVTPAKFFVHNNMVPFFKKGSYGDNSGHYDVVKQQKLELFTGSSNQAGVNHKKETPPRFGPLNGVGMTNLYGMPTVTGRQVDRYAMSLVDERKYQSTKPFEPIRVNTGLDLDYYAHGEDGYQPWYRPLDRNVDELRIATKPKIPLPGRVVEGFHYGKRAVQAPVYKNRPETYYENDPEDMLRTEGYVHAPTVRGNYYLKTTLKQQALFPYAGNPYGVQGVTVDQNMPEYMFPKIKVAEKNIYENPGVRNVTRDAGIMRPNYQIGQNERTTTQYTQYVQPAHPTDLGFVVDPNDVPKTTNKQLVENTAYIGILGPGYHAARVWDPKNVVKTTNKQLVENTKQAGYLGGPNHGGYSTTNWDAKTTNKQLVENTNQAGYLGGPNHGGYGTTNWDAKITNKQLVENTNQAGYLGGPKHGGYGTTNWDAKTTNKQLIENTKQGCNVSGSLVQNQGGYQYNHYDAKTTNKQLVENTKQGGNVSGSAVQNQGGYQYTNYDAKTTNKQLVENTKQGGNVSGSVVQNQGGYQYNHYDAKTTNKQLVENTKQGGNISGYVVQNQGGYQYTNYDAKTTNKQLVENTKQGGNVSGSAVQNQGGYQYTNYDAKTTNKQLVENTKQGGNVSGSAVQNQGGYQYTNYDAKTTNKQLVENTKQGGNISGSAVQNQGGYQYGHYDAKTTNKQLVENSKQGGNVSGSAVQNQGGYQYTNYDAKTTNKQLVENSKQGGNISGSAVQNQGGYQYTHYNAPTTLKQLVENSKQGGNVSGSVVQNQGGYQYTRWHAPTTVKESTCNVYYKGGSSEGLQHTGYQTNKWYAPTTVKESTVNVMRMGSGDAYVSKNAVYEPFYNMTMDDRKEILNMSGRMPTLSNYNKIPDTNMTEYKLKNDIDRIVYRDTMPDAYTFNPNQQVLPGCTTQISYYLPQENKRLDPSTVNSLITNPYHIPIIPTDCSQPIPYTQAFTPYYNPQDPTTVPYQQNMPRQAGFVNAQQDGQCQNYSYNNGGYGTYPINQVDTYNPVHLQTPVNIQQQQLS